MKIQSIKTKLLMLLLLSISCSFLILGFYNSHNEYDAQFDLIKKREQDLAKQTSKFINSYLKAKIDVVNASLKDLEKLDLSTVNQDIFNNLTYARHAGGFVEFYLGFEKSGDFIGSKGLHRTVKKSNYDPRKRSWYKEAVAKKTAGVSKPYVGKASGKLVVSIFAPLIKEGQLLGVVVGDIYLDSIVKSILDVKIGEVGFAYLVNSKGEILIHQDKSLIHTKAQNFLQIKSEDNTKFMGDFNQRIDSTIGLQQNSHNQLVFNGSS